VHRSDIFLVEESPANPPKQPSMRVLSFDIECASLDGNFPDAERDPVITIGAHMWTTDTLATQKPNHTMVFQTGSTQSKSNPDLKIEQYTLQRNGKFGKQLLTLSRYYGFRPHSKEDVWGSFWEWLGQSWAYDWVRPHVTLNMLSEWLGLSQLLPELYTQKLHQPSNDHNNQPPILPPQLYKAAWQLAESRLDAEKKMLIDFAQLIHAFSPHFITGYNVTGFDCPYIFKRASVLGIPLARSWGINGELSSARSRVSNRRGNTQRKYIVKIQGRVCLDLLPVIRKNYKLGSYTLNNVSKHFLEDTKDEMPYTDITPFWRGTNEQRFRLAKYCAQDALLPARLWDHLLVLGSEGELAKAVGITLKDVLSLGSGTQVLCLLLRTARRWDRFIPSKADEPEKEVGGEEFDQRASQFQGASVLDPVVGVHESVTTLDLAALYPSIIQSGNLCFTTDLGDLCPEDLRAVRTHNALFHLRDEKKGVTVGNFVSQPVFGGVLPTVLEALGDARKRAKKAMRRAKEMGEEDKRKALNARQLALKICANSCYGFCGSPILKNLTVSSSVTFIGRTLLYWTKNLVEQDFVKSPPLDLAGTTPTVIYGDTDSVMVKFEPTPSRQRSMELANAMESFINSRYVSRLDIEFETYYEKFVLYRKKRYAGLKCDANAPPSTPLKIATKGLEAQRRDSIPFLRKVMRQVLKIMLYEGTVPAIERVRQGARDLLSGNISPHELVLSSTFSRLDYSDEQPHVRLFIKLCKRNPRAAPRLGDRISFLLLAGPKGTKVSELSEDPLYTITHNLPLAYKLYFEKKYSKPICGLLEPLLNCDTAGLSRPLALRRLDARLFQCVKHVTPIAHRRATQLHNQRHFIAHDRCLGCNTQITSIQSTSEMVCVLCVSKYGDIRSREMVDKELACHKEKTQQLEDIWKRCRTCVGSEKIARPACANMSCDNFLKRIQKQNEMDYALRRRPWINIQYDSK
jgi:DNA polymerase delta subunit 1